MNGCVDGMEELNSYSNSINHHVQRALYLHIHEL